MLIAVERNAPLKFLDVEKKMWQTFGRKVPIDEHCRAVTSFGNFIYVGGSHSVYRYSIDSNTWDELPYMSNCKEGMYQLIVLGEHFYAISVCPERYSFREKSWQKIASDIKHTQTATQVKDIPQVKDILCVVGEAKTLFFDESKNQWVEKIRQPESPHI